MAPATERTREGAWKCTGFVKMWRTKGTAQFGLKGVEYGEFQGERRRVPSAVDREVERRRPRWCSRGERSEPRASTSPGDSGSKQLRALTHAGGAARAVAALDRAPRCTPGYCRHPYPSPFTPFCLFAKIDQNLNRSQISVEIKLVQNFECYKTSLKVQG